LYNLITMKKKILYVLLFVSISAFLILIIYKGKVPGDNSGKQLSQTEIDKLFTSLDQGIDIGELEMSHTDNDGIYDKFVLSLDKEEIEEDLFLGKTIVYEDMGEGYMGKMVLEFENTGDETKTYSHVENIPKSFATHVDNLFFSIPPTEIINPDPELSWEIEVVKRNIKRITINAKATAISAAVNADPAKAMEMMLVGMVNIPSQEMIEAGKEAAISVVLDNLGAVAFTKVLNDCSKFGGEGALWNTCIVSLIVKYPDMFIESDCEKIDIERSDAMNYIKGPVLHGICKAITTKDWNECHENADSWKEVDICKLALFKSFSGDCEYSADKDRCIYDASIKSDSQYGCNGIDEPVVKYECLAELTQEIKHCEMISDEDTREHCCDKISDDGARKECYGEKEEKEDISCGDKSEGLFRDSCWRAKATNDCDTDICITNFERDYDINECIIGVATKCGIEHCLDMKESQTFYNKISCIWILAEDEKDCALIGNEEYEGVMSGGKKENQESCLERVRSN